MSTSAVWVAFAAGCIFVILAGCAFEAGAPFVGCAFVAVAALLLLAALPSVEDTRHD